MLRKAVGRHDFLDAHFAPWNWCPEAVAVCWLSVAGWLPRGRCGWATLTTFILFSSGSLLIAGQFGGTLHSDQGGPHGSSGSARSSKDD